MPAILRIPLSIRVPLLTALLMVALGVVASQQVLAALDRLQDARIREIARLHVETLSVALGPHVLRDDVWEVYDTLQRAAGEGEGRRMIFTAVADEDGRVIAATLPDRAPLDSSIAEISDGAQPPANLTVPSDEETLRLVAPLVYQGRAVGQVVTELDVADLVAERRRAGRLLLLGNTVATGVLALLGYLLMRRMLRPITRLAQRMQDTSDQPEQVPETEIPRGDTELSRLVHTYNAMARTLVAKRDAERRLAERERFVSLGRLSSSLAHEINNPLGGLLNAADTIREYADRPEVVRRSAELLTRGLNHLRDVSRATLEQNRLDRSGAALSAEDFEDIHLLIGPEINRQAQRLNWKVEAAQTELKGVPAGPVRQIALNLLLNASAAAGRQGRVWFRAKPDGDHLRMLVADSGPGLSRSARARLLSSGPVPPGGGVGLRLVHDLVEEMGGVIQLDRRDGRTEIAVSLPLRGKENPQC